MYGALLVRITLIGGWLVLLFAGCTPLSPEARSKADPHLDFAKVLADPEQYVDRYLLAGGAIIALTDDGDGTLLDIQRWELSPCGVLLNVADDGNHLLVHSPTKLDGEEFAVGRLVTLCGRIIGKELLPENFDGAEALRLDLDEIHLIDTPFRYGLYRNVDPGEPTYVPPKGLGANHPYDPSAWAYPYSPFTYRVR